MERPEKREINHYGTISDLSKEELIKRISLAFKEGYEQAEQDMEDNDHRRSMGDDW